METQKKKMRLADVLAGHRLIQESGEIRSFVVDYGVDILGESGSHRTVISCRHAWWCNELIYIVLNRCGYVTENPQGE